MSYHMAKLWKNKTATGKFTGVETSGHTKDDGISNNPGRGPGHNGCRINLLIAELGKQGTKGG